MNEIFADSLTKKEVPQQDPIQDLKSHRYLYILRSIHSGIRPSLIAIQLGIPKTTFQHYLDNLKRLGIISKIGYGIWELSDEAILTLKTSTGFSPCSNLQDPPKEVPKQQSLSAFFINSDSVRAHAFVLTVRVPPHLRNWNNEARAKYLTRHNISFTELNIGGGGQRIIFKSKKVWLTNRSVVIYDRSSYLAESSSEARSYALSKLLSLIKGLERLLHADFTERAGRQYRFKVSRQHYALVKNALAKQYDAEGKKLAVYADRGLWFLIDNSFNLHEAETVHPETADADSKIVQDFFNSLKEYPVRSDQLLLMIQGITENQQLFAANYRTHLKVLRDLGKGVNVLTERIEELKGSKRLDAEQRTLELVEKK